MGANLHLHRIKAEQSYKVAKVAIDMGESYPAYLSLKEAVRATLAYINEDKYDKEYADKTKLKRLINDLPGQLTPDVNTEIFEYLLELEQAGLDKIIHADLEKLDEIRVSLKKLMGLYLSMEL